jgi:hypothetical protein
LHREVYVEVLGYFPAAPSQGPPAVSPHSFLHAAFVDGTCVGTLEMVPEAHNDGPSRNLLPIEQLRSKARGSIVIGSKLIVRRAFRGRLGIELTKADYAHGLANGLHYCILECYDHLVPLYERLGFRLHGGPIQDPVFGCVNTMVLDYLDYEHLRAVRSPFVALMRRQRLAAA